MEHVNKQLPTTQPANMDATLEAILRCFSDHMAGVSKSNIHSSFTSVFALPAPEVNISGSLAAK